MRISVHVVTGSSRSLVTPPVDADSPYRIHISSKPVDGKANDELIRLLAEHFKVAKSSISVYKGYTSRRKIIDIIR